MKKIVLVDDHNIVRNGIKELIQKLGFYSVVGEYSSGQAFLQSIASSQLPDLVVLDLNMPSMNGLEVVNQLNEKQISIPVLVLTLNEEDSIIVQLFRKGIRGYLKKDCSAETFKKALESIFDSGYYHNDFLTRSLQSFLQDSSTTPQEKILLQLSEREKDFLKWVCDDRELTYEQIGDAMNVTARTVDGYRESIFVKFGIKSKTGLVLFIVKNNLFPELI